MEWWSGGVVEWWSGGRDRWIAMKWRNRTAQGFSPGSGRSTDPALKVAAEHASQPRVFGRRGFERVQPMILKWGLVNDRRPTPSDAPFHGDLRIT
jgi:hypothetical protein